MNKIALCIPCYKLVPAESFICFMELKEQAPKFYDIDFHLIEGQYTPLARSSLADAVLEAHPTQNYEAVVWIDSDMVFTFEDFQNLVKSFEYAECDILTGLYYVRGPNYKMPCIYSIDKRDHMVKIEESVLCNMIKKSEDNLVDIDAAGFGFLIMKPEVLEKLKERNGKFIFRTGTLKDPFGEFFSGEDFNFFRDCKELGFKTKLDSNIKIKHWGMAI